MNESSVQVVKHGRRNVFENDVSAHARPGAGNNVRFAGVDVPIISTSVSTWMGDHNDDSPGLGDSK